MSTKKIMGMQVSSAAYRFELGETLDLTVVVQIIRVVRVEREDAVVTVVGADLPTRICCFGSAQKRFSHYMEQKAIDKSKVLTL